MKKIIFFLMVLTVWSMAVWAGGGRQGSGGTSGVKTLTMFVDETWWPYNTWDGDMPKWFTEQTGIAFDVTVATDATQLSIMVASGSLPDIVVTNNFNLMSNSATSHPLKDLVEKHNLDWTIHPAYEFINSAGDGQAYTIKVGWSADYEYKEFPTINPEGTGATMRIDIAEACMKEVGISRISTIEELERVFDACKKLYPGVQPYIISPLDGYPRFHEVLYGAARSGFVEQDGQSKVYIYDKNLKPALLKMNEWYRKGYILEENFSWTSGSIVGEWAVGGKVFMISANTAYTENQDRSCISASVPYRWTPVDQLYTPTTAEISAVTGWRGFYITKSCKDTKSAIEAFRFLFSKDKGYAMLWGIEGTDWQWNTNKTEVTFNYATTDAELIAMRQLRWGWLGHDGINNNMQYMSNPKTKAAHQWVGNIIKRDPVQGIIQNQMDLESAEYVIYQNIVELERTDFIKIILAKSAADAEVAYNNMIRVADQLGGQRLNQWANNLFPILKSKYDTVRNIGAEGWGPKKGIY